MQRTAADVMTPAPTTIDQTETLEAAGRLMAEREVGCWSSGPAPPTVQQVTTDKVITVGVSDPVETVVEVMRAGAVRRVPVLDGNVLAGIVSIGDLAVERDPDSTLADISRAQPNR